MIDDRDRGFLLGDGVFETLLVVNRSALWLDEHVQRMKKAARKLDIPFDADGILVTVKAALTTSSPSVVRVTLSRGVTARGLSADCSQPTLHVSCDPFDVTLIGQPLRLVTSSMRRNPSSVTDRHKTTSYANNIFAAREAKAKGADDALMLNQDGFVACTSIANVFMLKDETLVTPPEQDGALAGIMRRFLIEQSGVKVEIRSIEKDEIGDAQALFATNSLRFIAPVTHLDGEVLPTAPITRFMNAMLEAAQVQCGVNLQEKPS